METQYFRFGEVETGTPEYEVYLEFRYRVFCEEMGRIEPPVLPSGGRYIETDRYDIHSRHFVGYHKATGRIAGFVRVILPNPLGLNVTPRYIIERPLPYPDATDGNIGEISRMAISPEFRRRHSDRQKPIQGDPAGEMGAVPSTDGHRHHQPELVLGLYREVYQLCKRNGLAHCFAAMDSNFSRLLVRLGFPFVPVGPVNDAVDPPRRVFMISAREMEQSLGQRDCDVMAFMLGETPGDSAAGTASGQGTW